MTSVKTLHHRGREIRYDGPPIDLFAFELADAHYSGRVRQNGRPAISHVIGMAEDAKDLFRSNYYDFKPVRGAIYCHDVVEESANIRSNQKGDKSVRVYNPYGGHKTEEGQYLNDFFPTFAFSKDGREQAREGRHFCYMTDKLTMTKGKRNYYDQMRDIYDLEKPNPQILRKLLRGLDPKYFKKGIRESLMIGILNSFWPGFSERYRNLNIATAGIKTLDRKANTNRKEERDSSKEQKRYAEIKDGSIEDLKQFYMEIGVFDDFNASGEFSWNPDKLDRALDYKFKGKKLAIAHDNIIHYDRLQNNFLDQLEEDNEVLNKDVLREYMREIFFESAGILYEDIFKMFQEDPDSWRVWLYSHSDAGSNRGTTIRGTNLRAFIDAKIRSVKESKSVSIFINPETSPRNK